MSPFSLIILVFSGNMLLEIEFRIKKANMSRKKSKQNTGPCPRVELTVIKQIQKEVWKWKGRAGRQSKRTDRMTWHQEFWATHDFKHSLLLRGKTI